jgi:RNA polymerase sigma-70 factor
MVLAPVFQAVRPGADATPDLEDRLARTWAAARSAWPELPDDAESFIRHVAARLPTDVSTQAALDNLRAADLYLALHCARGCAAAIESFLVGPFTVARATLHKIRCPNELVEDLEQHLRTLFLVGYHPKLFDYAGRGDLKSWVASIAARVARKKQAAEHRRVVAVGRVGAAAAASTGLRRTIGGNEDERYEGR